MRRTVVAAAALVPVVWLAVGAGSAMGAPAPAPTGDPLKVWHAQISAAQIPALAKAGADTTEIELPPAGRTGTVEVVLTDDQAAEVRAGGVRLAEHRATAPAGDGVFRPYSGPGGLAEELRAIAQQHPGLAKVESIGKTVQGKDILAVKVTKDAQATKDGTRPGTLYLGAQHAREWITPEMVRRLMHRMVDGYGADPRITALVDTTELWFLPVANPDGYDLTFSGQPGTRLWRKNLRDNDHDGAITVGDGVDLNRNFGWHWGWDDEGSSPDRASDLFRGPGPDSEPETKAFNAFEKRVRPEIALNFHSAAQVLLYGVGWQTATATPDDVLYRTLAGVPGNSAVPGTRPQVTSDISTSNGDSAGHSVNANGVLMMADEMSSCRTAALSVPDDEWLPENCPSSFEFPDSEALIQAEFANNVPLALSAAESAADPANPKSTVGLTAAPLTAHAFTTSYAGGAAQTVAVTAARSLTGRQLRYRVNGGPEKSAGVTAWKGGDVYGGTDNLFYDEYRGKVVGAAPGATVEAWFTGTRSGKAVSSAHFSYRVADRARGDVLVLADEGGPQAHAGLYTAALAEAGHQATVWDVATQGAPDDLGVLSHFRTVVWEVGDQPAAATTTLAVRDFLNEGGKLVKAGRAAAQNVPLNATQVNVDDFAQYWLGVDAPAGITGATGFTGAGVLAGAGATLRDPAASVGSFSSISDSLPSAQFPQFAAVSAGTYAGVRGPFEPFAGTGMAAVRHSDNAYARLTRTIDLTGVTAAQRPALSLALSFHTEPGWDHFAIEAHSTGADDWTTLAFDGSSATVPLECSFLSGVHPFLTHYLTPTGQDCTATGSSGSWRSVTGAGNGWRQVSADLSAFAGRKVEVSLAYLSDTSTGGRGVFVDEAGLTVGGVSVDKADFESGFGPWVASGNGLAWGRSGAVLRSYAAVSTARTVTLGFGLDAVASPAARTATMRDALR